MRRGGVDLIENAVKAAIGIEPLDVHQASYRGHWAEVVIHAEASGKFDHLLIEPSIRKNIIETDLWVKPGDEVMAFNGANNAIGIIILHFKDEENMKFVLNHQNSFINVCIN